MSENNYELNDVEMRILQLLAKGITSYDKIGSEIFFGRRVVGRRLNDIGKKLGASGQVNILRQALLKDILTIDDLKGGEA